MDKILLVDDSALNNNLLGKLLSKQNYEVFTSENGLTALAKVKHYQPDLVVMDVNLSDVSGYDVCKKIKSDPELLNVLILLLNSVDSHEARSRAFEVGADDFLEKSFDSFVLVSKCKSILRIKHLSMQLTSKFRELAEKNNILDRQLKMARSVQRALIPELDIFQKNVHIISRYLPALEVGGDFYKVFHLKDELFSIVLGDVSGHGISASLLTTMLTMMITNLANNFIDPEQVLYELNNEFCTIFENSQSDMSACILYAVVNTEKKTISLANAGQPYPTLANRYEVFDIEATGIPVGLFRDVKYQKTMVSYHTDDLLFLYTDGLKDAFYKNNPDEFHDILCEVLMDSINSSDLSVIADIVLNNFYRQQLTDAEKLELDDVCLLLCKM